jgi:hypothetical protein
MPGPLKLGVEVKGRDQLLRKVKNIEADVIAPPWREAMEGIGIIGQAAAVRAAPLGSQPGAGRTISMMYHRVQQKPLPMWVKVATKAKRVSRKYPRGYAYPRKLNYDPRSPIKGWFDKAMGQTRAAAVKVLDVAAKKMEKAWKAG